MASDEELDVADISLPSTGKRKIKSASRKKQTSACDGCRKGKTRCDGNTPCGRCIKRGIVCTYSPQKRRGVRKKPKLAEEVPISLEPGVAPKLDGSTAQGAQQAKSEDSSDALPNHDDLLDVYFKYINELLLRPITREELEQHTSKASLMQYNVALAFAARCSNKKKMAASFERRARTLAGDLFDDFTQETATAFALLTAYYWGQEEAKCKFYGTVTRGLCRQLAPSIDPAAVIMIEVVASCCLVQWEQYIGDLLDRIRSALETTTETKFRRQLQIALLLLEVKYGLIRAYPVNDDQKYLAILFDTEQLRQNMSPEVANFLERKLNAAENLLLEVQNPTNLSNIWPLVQVFFGCFRSMLYFAKGDLETAEKLSRQVVDTASEYQNLLFFSPPAIVHCIHYSFCVAYTRGNIPLAVRTTGLLRKISTVLPIAEVPLWSDTRYLKALLNQSGANNANRPQTPSLSTSQNSFAPSEQESRFFAEASHDFDALKYVPISTPLHVPRGAASNSSVNNAQTPSSQFLVFPENMRTLPTEPYFSSTPASSNRTFNPSRQNLSCMYMLNSRFMNEPRSGVNPFDKEANLNPFFETDFAATEPLRWDM